MNTRPIVTTVILILICLPWSVGAQQSVGVRLGVSADPDQFLFDGHLETGPLLERLVFRHNAEIGVGDDLIVIGLNFEFAFKIALDDQAWTPYLGAGPAVNIIDRSDSGRGRGDTRTHFAPTVTKWSRQHRSNRLAPFSRRFDPTSSSQVFNSAPTTGSTSSGNATSNSQDAPRS